MKNKLLFLIGLFIPVSWILLVILMFIDDESVASDLMYIAVGVVINLPVFAFIIYGIRNAKKSEDTIPRVKERMPWNYGKGESVDEEWRRLQREKEEKQNQKT